MCQGPGEIKSREVELGSRENEGYAKSRKVELGSHSRMACLAAELFLNSCFSDIVFVTLLCTVVKTAINEVHKLFLTDGVLTFTLLFWWWLAVSSVFVGRVAGRATHGYPTPLPLSLIHI